MRPTWRDYRFAVIATLVWAAFTFTFNSITGTNYGYLNRKPPTASILDVLGPWPVYLFTEVDDRPDRVGADYLAVGAVPRRRRPAVDGQVQNVISPTAARFSSTSRCRQTTPTG